MNKILSVSFGDVFVIFFLTARHNVFPSFLLLQQSSFSLDLGTSFMDEVMKAFSDVTDKDKTPTDERRSLVLEDGSPHLNQYAQSSHSKSNGISSFDNLALNTDYGDLGNDLDSSLQEQKENEENSAMDTSRSSELVGSRSSSSATLGSQASDEVPSPAVEKKRKPKLRIVS